MPDVPTFAELGYPEFTTRVWFGLFVRAGTPAPIVESLLAAAKTAHADTDVRAELDAQGFDMSGQTGPELLPTSETERALGAPDQGVGLQSGLTPERMCCAQRNPSSHSKWGSEALNPPTIATGTRFRGNRTALAGLVSFT